MPERASPSSGTWFHSLHATSQALQPMQTVVSVKKPIRGGWSRQPLSLAGSLSSTSGGRRTSDRSRSASEAVSTATEHLHPRLGGDPGPALVALDEGDPRRPAWTAPGDDVDAEGLHLLDVDVRVKRDLHQLVGGIPPAVAVRAPVPGQADLVHDPVLEAERGDAVGDKDAGLDGVACCHDR